MHFYSGGWDMGLSPNGGPSHHLGDGWHCSRTAKVCVAIGTCNAPGSTYNYITTVTVAHTI